MNRLGTVATLLSFGLLTAVPACDSGDGDTSTTNADETTGTDSNADAGDGDSGAEAGDGDGTGDGDTGNMAIATIDGVVLDAAGEVLPTPGGQLCGPVNDEGEVELCRSIMAGDDGSWTAEVFKEGVYNMKWVHQNQDGRNFSGVAEPITVAEGDEIVVEQTYVVPEVGAITDFTDGGTADVDMGDGLTLTIVAEDMSFGLGVAPEVGGAPIPQDQWRMTEHNGETIIAMWAMAPFGAKTTAEDGVVAFTLANGLGLDGGATVNFYELDKDNGWIHPAGSGTVSTDGSSIEPDSGLHRMATFIVTAAN